MQLWNSFSKILETEFSILIDPLLVKFNLSPFFNIGVIFGWFIEAGEVLVVTFKFIKWTKITITVSGRVRMSKEGFWSTPEILFGVIDPRTIFTSANVSGLKKTE